MLLTTLSSAFTIGRTVVAATGAAGFRAFSASTPALTKLKTHKGTAKRVKALANGAFKRAQTGKRHLNTGMSGGKVSKLRGTIFTDPTHAAALKRLLPNK